MVSRQFIAMIVAEFTATMARGLTMADRKTPTKTTKV